MTGLYVSAFTTLLTAIFAGMVLERFIRRNSPHLFAWAVGLCLYSLGMLAQAVLALGFDALLFRLWYWAGALLVATWLGQGTIFLLVRRGNAAWYSFWAIVALSAVGWHLIMTAEVNPAAYMPGVDLSEQYKDIFAMSPTGQTMRTVLAIAMNTYGTLTLVGGALFSIYLFVRKQVLPNRVGGNVLIALGGLLPALGGTLILLGDGTLKYVAQLGGALSLFAGFMLASYAPQAWGMKSAVSAQEAEAPR